MKAVFLLLALVGGVGAQEHRDEAVLITSVTADPPAESGVIAFAVQFEGVADGATRTYLIPFLSMGQSKPRAGQHCSVEWSRFTSGFGWMLADGREVWRGRLVSRFDCRGSRPFPDGGEKATTGWRAAWAFIW